MLDLSPALRELFAREGTLLVPSRQRAAAVRLAYAAAALRAGLRTWHTPEVLTPQAWLLRHLQRSREAGAELPRVLRSAEEWVLWRSVAAGLVDAHAPLLSVDALAKSLRSAASLGSEYAIDAATLTPFGAYGGEPAWLLAAMLEVERNAGLVGAIPNHLLLPSVLHGAPLTEPTRPLLMLGLEPLAPRWREVLLAGGAEWLQTGCLPAAQDVAVIAAADPHDELALAAAWCREQLFADPTRRLLVIAPDMAAQRAAVTRVFRDALCPNAVAGSATQDEAFVVEGGQPLSDYPWVRQNLTALELLLRPQPLERVLEWLRSPFWQVPTPGARARLDLHLRERLFGDCSLQALLGLLRERVQQNDADAQQLLTQLTAAAAALSPESLPPREWAKTCASALALSGCSGTLGDSALAQQLQGSWQDMLAELGDVGHTVPRCTAHDAVNLLAQLADQGRFAPASGDAAVTLLAQCQHPVVHYDGIWVCGRTAAAWPAVAEPDAFIPYSLQRDAQMPSSSAIGQLAMAEAELSAWRSSAFQLRLSWARRMDDADSEPSALLADIATRSASTLPVDRLQQLRVASVPTQRFDDDRGPDWDPATHLPGGSRSLELQDACAFRAFAELRLGAEPLETAAPGTDRRERGRLLHKALQLFWEKTRDRNGLLALTSEMQRERIVDSLARAASTLYWPTQANDRPASRNQQREQARALRQLERLCEFEKQRDDFRVAFCESGREARIGAALLRIRIDRIDVLADAASVLIDYKTSEPPPRREWLQQRPRPVQLLVYLAALGAGERQRDDTAALLRPIAALASLHVGRRAPSFHGVGDAPGRLPGVTLVPGTRFWNGANAASRWDDQLQRWQARMGELAAHFLAGRALPDPLREDSCRICALTALCRRVERVRYELGDADDAQSLDEPPR